MKQPEEISLDSLLNSSLDQLDNMGSGDQLHTDLMSQAQSDYIMQLLDTCILATVQKDEIHALLQNKISKDHASDIIDRLLNAQNNPLNRIRDGELLLMKDVKKAITRAVQNPNT